MNRTLLLAFTLVLGCDKKPKPTTEATKPATDATKPATDAACAAKVKDVEPWLAKLEVETRSHELDFGYTLQVIDREPMPVSHHIDTVEITKGAIAVFDISEHDHARNPLAGHQAQRDVADRLVKIHAMKAGPDEFDPADNDLLRVDVDQQAAWGDVARVIDAATQAGYARVVFGFTATSKLAQPPGVAAATGTEQAARDASDKLEALQKQCKPYSRAAMHMPARDLSPADDAAKHAKEVAAALAECNCVPDPDELRKLAWIDARWHQARPRVGVVLPLDRAATTTIALPAKTPWSAAHAKLLEATGPVKLVTTS